MAPQVVINPADPTYVAILDDSSIPSATTSVVDDQAYLSSADLSASDWLTAELSQP